MAGKWDSEPHGDRVEEKKTARAALDELEDAISGLKGISDADQQDLKTRLKKVKKTWTASDC